jgi:hypothetical protein
MAVEAKRGCGYRKVGGLYLVGGGIGIPCDRLPLQLDVCPCCGAGIKPSLGWTWVDVAMLVQGPHIIAGRRCHEALDQSCTFCAAPELMGRAGLLWIGEQFYKTLKEFVAEGVTQGFSRRIAAVPRNFKPGETWVLLAHRKAVPVLEPTGAPEGSLLLQEQLVMKPGVFYVWKPERIEKICTESQRGSEEVAAIEKRGIIPVFVPDDDPDHQGSAYDKKETEEAPETEGPLFGKENT